LSAHRPPIEALQPRDEEPAEALPDGTVLMSKPPVLPSISGIPLPSPSRSSGPASSTAVMTPPPVLERGKGNGAERHGAETTPHAPPAAHAAPPAPLAAVAITNPAYGEF